MTDKRTLFNKNRYNLNELFFSFETTVNVKISKAQIEEFWLFLNKYLEKTSEIANQEEKYKQLFQKLIDDIPDEWKHLDKLYKQLQTNSKNNIHKSDLLLFRNILLVFVDFTLKRRLKKSEKYRQFQENLPIFEYKKAILDKIQSNSVVLIAGDTGCGKSTQVPQYLLRHGYERICCTQPRRIACIALSKRLAVETCDEYGRDIGYQIRFEKSKTKSTKILFLTEGLLLRQMIQDPLLSNYQVIILDEIHERHLTSDFLLGAIKCLLHKRKHDLKVILMSATVNCELFSNYFGQCQVIQVPGRLYPIKTEYFPPEKVAVFKGSQPGINPEQYLKILTQIDSQYPPNERGDVLVFLSGFAEIEKVGNVLKSYASLNQRWIVLYLHSALSVAEQDKVFDIAPEGVRKCILSTNIAETSITIDGIRFVIDSGKVKEMYYESKIRMHRLQEIWISKASAEQRKGRAGRTGPGICYRLYSQNDFNGFVDFSKPEIQRTSLDLLILNMISMGLNDVRKFPFIEPPSLTDIENTLKSLIAHGTLNDNERITYLGRILSKLPVEISIGKLLIYSLYIGKINVGLSLAACLSVQSLSTIRSKNDCQVNEERESMLSKDGDLFSSLNFYQKWLMKKSDDLNTKSWCKRLGFEEQRFHEITKLRRQFQEILTDSGLFDSNQLDDNIQEQMSTRKEKIGKQKAYKRLKSMVRASGPKKPKLLRLDQDQNEDDGDDDSERKPEKQDLEWNLKELEFSIKFDCNYFTNIKQKHDIELNNHNQVLLMKAILAMCFYPQVAIADLDNSYEPGSDLIYHTKDKPFVVVHPSSFYHSHPDFLRTKSRTSLMSYSKELLGYIQFIETNKSYICNCFKLDALHTLLLSVHELDTNENCDRMVCDRWIEIHFQNENDAQNILINAYRIRNQLLNYLELTFEKCNSQEDISSQLISWQEKLCKELNDYMSFRVNYSVKRLLAADLKIIYSAHSEMKPEDFMKYKLFSYFKDRWKTAKSDQLSDHKKAGFHYSFINYNCLKNEEKLIQENEI